MVQEWRKIGARRTKFLDLGLPIFGPPRRILVQSAAAACSNQETQTSADSNQTQLVRQDDVKEARQDELRGGEM